MGKSRSATICVAYLLHGQPRALNPERALAIVREGRPMCEPNEGFMEQLTLYHQMGCPDDVTSQPLYQRWLSNREIEESIACGRAPEIESVRFEDEISLPTANPAEKVAEIRCRKCRLVISFCRLKPNLASRFLLFYNYMAN
jgi:dual specificity phosphatase 12